MTTIDQSKRAFFRTAGLGAAGALAGALAPVLGGSAQAASRKTDLSPEQALQLLKDGNRNYLTDGPIRRVQGRERRLEIARGQTPFAVLVSCSDSRVPPELLYGRDLGELQSVQGRLADTAAELYVLLATYSRASAAVVQEGYDTICTAPLLDGDHVLGLLNVYHDQRHEWTGDELETIAALATQASVAIRTAQN